VIAEEPMTLLFSWSSTL